ncbi:unnamed protein product [Effrenium voratum]|nr:unnamed protein product [Effrenium voratum]
MQKAWRAHSARRQATQKKAAEEAARSLKEDSQEEAAEKPVHAVNEGSQEEAAEKPVHAVKEDSREEAAEKPVLAVKQDSQEEAVEKPVPAVKEAWSEQATSQQLIAMKVQSEVSSEWDLESLASWQVVPEARRCWLERFVASAHDLQPSLYGAFILPDSEEGQEQKCAECFEQLMKLHLQDKRKNWGAVARKECGNYAKSIMKAHGKAKPFGLELDELFALVAYAYDHPPAPPSANFWALLGSLVRERQLQEAGLFLRYFKQAVEKRMQRQPEATFLYCAMPEMNLTLEEGMYIYWRTFTSWTRHLEVARSAGAGVIRLTTHWVCEISEFSEYCVRNRVSEVILQPNQVLKVVACPGISEGHDIALDLLEEEEGEQEEEDPF